MNDHTQTCAAVAYPAIVTYTHALSRPRSTVYYMFVTDFCNRFVYGSLIIARVLAVGKGVGLYVGRLICEYIW